MVGTARFVIIGEGVERVAAFLLADLGDVEVADGILDRTVPQVAGQLEDGDSAFQHVRGVAVSSYIIRTLMDREWIRVLGYRDVPGKPAMFGTSKEFLDYFNMKSLQDLPTLAEIKDLETLIPELDLEPKIAPSNKQDTAFKNQFNAPKNSEEQ